MRRSRPAVAPLLSCLALLGCGSEAAGPDVPAQSFTVTLSAANVVGANIGLPGTGTATFDWDGTRLNFVLNVQNMNQIIAAHVHGPATTSQNADILLNLFIPATATGTVNGELARGAAVAGSPLFVSGSMASLLNLMIEGRAYVLVHTVANPDGEIRGQVLRQGP